MEKIKIKNVVWNIITIMIIIIGIIIYRKYDFNFFVKGVLESNSTVFSRDSETTYLSQGRSYKIENKTENDAMFYKKIEVEPNTPYKVTCMIKTENVECDNNINMGGAQICLNDTEEHSKVLSGDNEWTKVELYFNSKNNKTIEVGFRLGGNFEKVSGVAWFDDLKIEKGYRNESNEWYFGCFILENIDAQVNGQNIVCNMSSYDKTTIVSDMERFKNSIESLTNNKIAIKYDIINIQESVKTLSYDDENGCYLGEKDVYDLINSYVEENEYDHIFVCMNLPFNSGLPENKTCNWVGLGNLMYLGKGFSNIRIVEGEYTYSNSNRFPEEVFLHEFLHTLERNSKDYGYTIPELHDYELYGYQNTRYYGLRDWYVDYMNKTIVYNNTYIGLPEIIYTLRPVQSEDFKYSYEIDSLAEPKNILENIESIMVKIKNVFKTKSQTLQSEGATE